MKLSDAPLDKLTYTAVKLRDDIAKMEARHKDELAPLKGKMDKLEAEALRRLLQEDAKHFTTDSGTIIKNTKTSVTVADWDSFFTHYVVPNQAWELLEHRASKVAVLQIKEETGDIPPGLNYSEMYTASFRRS